MRPNCSFGSVVLAPTRALCACWQAFSACSAVSNLHFARVNSHSPASSCATRSSARSPHHHLGYDPQGSVSVDAPYSPANEPVFAIHEHPGFVPALPSGGFVQGDAPWQVSHPTYEAVYTTVCCVIAGLAADPWSDREPLQNPTYRSTSNCTSQFVHGKGGSPPPPRFHVGLLCMAAVLPLEPLSSPAWQYTHTSV